RRARDGARHQGAHRYARHGGDLARCRRGRAGAGVGEAHRRAARHHRQAPRAAGRIRGDEHHRRRRGPLLHPGRRHRRLRRHALQRRRRAARERRAGGLRLHHSWRALGRGHLADRLVQAEGTRHDGLDPADRRREGRPQHPGDHHRAAHRRGDRAHGDGNERVEPVRL
ncbi:MAG: Ribose-phosphate pyrophosphokinase, partial [uncultured Microvirga sp.]